jgi:acyl-CoA thioester hydrolase
MGKSILPYQVAYADTDMMGVVYYANYLVFFERARTTLLEDLGYPYTRLEKEGFGLPVIEAHCKYRLPALYGERLQICAWPDSIRGVRLKVACEVRRGGDLLAEGYTVHCGVSLATKRPAALPAAFREACASGAPAGA